MILTLRQWVQKNEVSNRMYWKEGAIAQFETFQKIADNIDAPIFVIGTHRSKSIDLPVVQIMGSNGTFVIRDNFYDYNLAVAWDFPINIPLSDVYPERDWEWYLDQIKRKEGYDHWDQWTEEELNDPRITRIEVSRRDGSKYWKTYTWEEKQRWLNRFKDTEWYTKDWSSGKLIVDGKIPDCKLYIAGHPYRQGMEHIDYDCYEPGVTHFLISIGDTVGYLIRKINCQVEDN